MNSKISPPVKQLTGAIVTISNWISYYMAKNKSTQTLFSSNYSPIFLKKSFYGTNKDFSFSIGTSSLFFSFPGPVIGG